MAETPFLTSPVRPRMPRGRKGAAKTVAPNNEKTMSAYIVNKNHIMFLLAAMGSRSILGRGSRFSYYWDAKPDCRTEVDSYDPQAMADVGNLLLRENLASVTARYPRESSATLPGPRDHDCEITPADIGRYCYGVVDPVQVLKACDCLEYQSCEHDGWRASEARAVLEALRRAAWHALPGYDGAEWGAPERMAGAVSLMQIAQRA